MSAKWICDGCGKEEPAAISIEGYQFIKPHLWFERSDERGIQTACSVACIRKISKEPIKLELVLPR